jgi:hypothetical protein
LGGEKCLSAEKNKENQTKLGLFSAFPNVGKSTDKYLNADRRAESAPFCLLMAAPPPNHFSRRARRSRMPLGD